MSPPVELSRFHLMITDLFRLQILLACKRCNGEKRRHDSLRILSLAPSGWESFLSHDGTRCSTPCRTCLYWETIWTDGRERALRLRENLERVRSFRAMFLEFQKALPSFMETQPALLTKLYIDCQSFAEREINSLLTDFDSASDNRRPQFPPTSTLRPSFPQLLHNNSARVCFIQPPFP